VLPFDNLSGDPEQNYFVAGLTEQLIAGLAHFKNIQVIARNSTSKYEGQAVDVRDVGRDLGVAYVLEGSVRRDRSTVRITAQLIDARNGAHLWAETYERDLSAASIFAVQDEITAQVASIIAGHSGVIARQLVGAAAGRRTDDLAAFECVLLAYRYDRVFSKDNYLAARGCLENAIERDPDYAEALGALSYIYADGFQMGLAEEVSSIDFLAEAYRLAFRAVELEPTSASVQRQLAMAYFYNGELDGFHEHAERALTLNPHDPTTLGQLGMFIAAAGDFARGGPLVHKAFALNADLPYWYKFTFAGEHYWKGEWEAGRVLMEGLDTSDDNPFTHHWHLLFLGELGLRDRATEVLARLRKITPSVSIAEFRTLWAKFNPPAGDMERYAASWRKAGVPEEPPKTAKTVESKK
jgi:TolB-like protein